MSYRVAVTFKMQSGMSIVKVIDKCKNCHNFTSVVETDTCPEFILAGRGACVELEDLVNANEIDPDCPLKIAEE